MDNQLLGTTQPVVLCVTPSSADGTVSDSAPALQVNSVKVPSSLMLTDIFKVSIEHIIITLWLFTLHKKCDTFHIWAKKNKIIIDLQCECSLSLNITLCLQHLMVTAGRFTVIIEEKLLLKMLSFFGYGQTEAGR